MKYSYSLSFGVKEAFNMGVAPEELIIITGSCFPSKETCIAEYGKYYWKDTGMVDLFTKLWDMGHIIQPRALYGNSSEWCPHITNATVKNFVFDTLDEMVGADLKGNEDTHNRKIVNALIADGHTA